MSVLAGISAAKQERNPLGGEGPLGCPGCFREAPGVSGKKPHEFAPGFIFLREDYPTSLCLRPGK